MCNGTLVVFGYKIMTQKFTKNISYMIYPSPATSFIAVCTADYSIAINTTS